MSVRRRRMAQESEDLACTLLRKAGLTILDRNVRCALGELDLVARDGKTVVFVEVRSRKGNARGTAKESVSLQKRRRIVRLALWYLKTRGLAHASVRFDVVLIQWGQQKPDVEWIRNAFDAEGAV